MKPRLGLAVFVGLQSAAACFVPTFDVDPARSAGGGASAAGGNAQTATGGKGGTTTAHGGTDASVAGTRPAAGGEDPGAAGESPGAAGQGQSSAGGAGGAEGFPGPTRVGFSVFHDSASGENNASGSLIDATFTKPPATEPGDFMLVFLGADHALKNLTGSDLDRSGWKALDEQENYGTDGQALYLLYKFAEAAEPQDIVFANINDPDYTVGVQGLLSVYRGVNPSSPINDYQTFLQPDGTETVKAISTKTPEVTTTADNCLLIAGLGPDSAIDSPVITAWPDGFDLHRMSVVNPHAPFPFGWTNIYQAERRGEAAGTVAPSKFDWQITYDGSLYYGALTFVLALAP